jgi:carbon dioxide concentrating mechanism protein CcmO
MDAYGFVETRGFIGVAEATDAMNKAAEVEYVRQEQIGGSYVTTICRGEVGAVKAAVAEGVIAAKKVGLLHTSHVIPRLHEDVVQVVLDRKPLDAEIQPHSALGMVETVGFPPMVEAADAGVKAADVILAGYVIVGSGYSTAIFRGEVAAVRSAVAAAKAEAAKVGKVVSSHVIPSPHPYMQQVLPVGLKDGKKSAGIEIPKDMESSLGFMEFKGFIGLVEATDAGIKAAHTVPVGWQKVGSGMVTILLQGDVAAVKSAVDAGGSAGARVGELISTNVIARPHEALEDLKKAPKKK